MNYDEFFADAIGRLWRERRNISGTNHPLVELEREGRRVCRSC